MADIADEAVDTTARPETTGAEEPGNEDRGAAQSEIRDAIADGLCALGGFDSHASAVTIVPGGASTFHGPVAGRDIIMGGERDNAVLLEVPARTIDEIRRVHVPPGGYDELAGAIRRDPLVLVCSPARWGTTTSVVHLLGRTGPVHQIKFSGPLATLPIADLPADGGLVLTGATRAQIAELRARDLPALDDQLARRRSRLVVTFDAGLRVPDPGTQRRVVGLASPPPAVDLVTSHLADRISAPRAARFLAAHGLTATLEAIDAGSYDVRQLVEFARDLADAAEDRCTVDDATGRFQERSRQDLEEWLDGIADHDQKATVVSLAVLDGMPYAAVARAATLLEQAWRLEDAGGGTAAPRARQPKSKRLAKARARLTREFRNTRFGRAELEIASFVDDSYPGRLLHHLWHEHDYDRDLLLGWLREVAEDVEGGVRIRAATAIGYLAQYDFDTIRRDVITTWAGSGNGDERERAVAALSLPARHPDTAARTVRLVLSWSERKSGPLRLSAARALGESVGATLPHGPDERLAELAKNAEPALAIAIGDSIGGLLLNAPPARRLALLRLLDDWSGQTRVLRQTAGVWGFLEVAQGLSTTVPGPDGALRWPTVLRLAEEDPDAREVVVRLFGRVMRAPGVENGVRQVLRSWARSAEREPRLREPLVRLMVDVAGLSPRLGTLVCAHARTWRQREPVAPDLALRLLEALDRTLDRRGIR